MSGWPDTIEFYGFGPDNNRTSPEHRLWISVLITFIDELIRYINQAVDLEKRIETSMHKDHLSTSLVSTNKQIKDLIDLAKSNGTKNICELIDIDHRWFYSKLQEIAQQRNMKSRPTKQIDYGV